MEVLASIAAVLVIVTVLLCLERLVAAARRWLAEQQQAERTHDERQRQADTEVSAGDSLPDRTVVERLRRGGF